MGFVGTMEIDLDVLNSGVSFNPLTTVHVLNSGVSFNTLLKMGRYYNTTMCHYWDMLVK